MVPAPNLESMLTDPPSDRRITECSVPESPWFLDVGTDGAIWFTTFHDSGIQIGRISPEVGRLSDSGTGGAGGRTPPEARPSSPAPSGGRLPSTGQTTTGVAASLSLAAAGVLLRRQLSPTATS